LTAKSEPVDKGSARHQAGEAEIDKEKLDRQHERLQSENTGLKGAEARQPA
jgi:hypothetical protein